MKKLMVIGASVLQLPAIKRGKELGFEVAAVDYDENAVGIKYADKFYNISTIDAEGVTEAAKDFKANGIMTLASDMPMRSVARAGKELGLPAISEETAICATDKGEMIKCFKKCGVPSPWYFIAKDKKEFEELLEKVEYPCIMKPLDNSGSRGIILAKSKEELKEGYEYSSSNSRGAGVIVEEFLTGKEISVEVMTVNGKAYVLAVTDKTTTGHPHFVETGHAQQSEFTGEIRKQIEEVAKKAVFSVGIENGPAHVEMMVTDKGPKMIELGARMGGDCITTHLVPLSTGIDMVEATIRVACGETPDLEKKFDKGSAIRYFNVPKGKIKEIKGVEEAEKLEGVKEITFVKNVGDEAVEINSSADRVGFIIAQGRDAFEAKEICKKAMEMIKIVIE